MKMDRRTVLQGLMGTVFISLSSSPSVFSGKETTEARLKRLFKRCRQDSVCLASGNFLPNDQVSNLRLNCEEALIPQMPDSDFLKALDQNVRQDFVAGRVYSLEGWQISETEVVIMAALASD